MWESWEKKEEERLRRRTVDGEEENGGSGKGKRPSVVDRSAGDGDGEGESGGKADALVLFACRHLWHRECLGTKEGAREGGRLKCPLCVE